MTTPIFPAFLKLEKGDTSDAGNAFIAEVDRILDKSAARLTDFSAAARRNLDSAFKLGTTANGGLNLDIPGLRESVAALEKRAAVARQLANAEVQAARSTGAFTQEARASIAAQRGLADETERAAAMAKIQLVASERLQAELNRQAGASDAAAAAARRTAAANDNVTQIAGAQRQGLQQLSFQINDIATMYALGAKPAQIFSSQIGQVTQAIQLATNGTSKFARFLGGPMGIAIVAATTVLAPFVGKLFESSDAAEKSAGSLEKAQFASSAMSGAQSILGNVLDLTTGKITAQTSALVALARAQIAVARVESMERQAKAGADISKFTGTYGPRAVGASTAGAFGVWGRDNSLAQLNEDLRTGKKSTDQVVKSLEGMVATGQLTRGMFVDLAKAYANFGVEAENQKIYQDAEKLLNGTGGQGLLKPDTHKPGGRGDAMSDAEKATKRANEATQSFITSLEDEIARLGLNAKQLRMLEVAKARDAAVTDAQKAKISELSAAREIAIKREEALAKIMERVRQAQSIRKADNDRLAALDREFALLGKVGPAREVAALELEKEAFMAEHAALGIQGATAAWEDYFTTSLRNIQEQSRLERDAEAAERARDAIADLAQSLSGLGGAGGIAGTLLNLTQGRFGNIGGPFGALLQTVNAIPMGRNPDGSTRYLADRIEAIFSGKNSPFGQTISGLLQGAGTGILSSATILGEKGNNIGAAIGGALGQAAGNAIGGPIGGAIGSALGGLLGGVIGAAKVKKGYAIVGNNAVTVGGNSSALMASSKTSGTGIQSAINAIAEQLGAQVGDYAVSIGKRSSGYIRVSASGSSKVADKSFAKKGGADLLYDGKDEAEAMRIAILNALQDGAIKGIREGAQRLLKAGGDLETQMKKALDFESVFTRLKGYTDPVGAALDTLDREFERLKKVFGEAGATAAEYADLEKLYGLERAKAIKSALDQVAGSLRSFLDDLGIGDNGLSLRDRQAAAQAKYAPLAERVRAGDSTAFDDYAQASRDLLDITRQLYGSQSPYFDLMGQIRSEGQGALDKAQAAADLSAGRDSPFSNSPTANTSDNAAVVGAIDAQTEALLAGLGGRLDLLNSNLVTSLQMQAANSNDGGVLFGRIGNKSYF